MRIFINQRNKFQIEKDLRVAKCNYGSRLYYLIEDAILEKRICYNNSLLNQEQTIYNMINLKSCYDRQLAQIESMVQELVGVERLQIKLFAKLIPVIEYYIYTSLKI